MDCACVAIEMDDYVNVLDQKIVTARKKHKCHECGKTILPKEKYEYQVYVFEGEITAHKTCLDCISIREVFFSCGYTYENIWNDLYDHIYECAGEIKSELLNKLTPTSREKVVKIIDKYYMR